MIDGLFTSMDPGRNFKSWQDHREIIDVSIDCFVTLRRGRQLVYERNMIDELTLRLVHGSYQ
jgi:hypothetical protein